MTGSSSKGANQNQEPKKSIILCSDGTGNRGGKGNGTNVWHIYNYIDLNCHNRAKNREQRQITYYEDGVGTEDFKLLKIFSGAFGLGLSRNIQELYDFLIKNYNEGDDIYLFGFSRGGFTVRSLAGLIQQCGIPNRNLYPEPNSEAFNETIERAYELYKDTHRKNKDTRIRNYFAKSLANKTKVVKSDLTKKLLNKIAERLSTKEEDLIFYDDTVSKAQIFKDNFSHKNITIHFIGVWDTVSAIGIPFGALRKIADWWFDINFHDSTLGKDVKHAYHALSIDDERQTFAPMLWDENPKEGRIQPEQVWFSGVHSNVGGGYPKQGMAHVSLLWMMKHAADCNLIFKNNSLETVKQAADVTDKMYDSRSGFAIYYRYLPRKIQELCEKRHVENIKVHVSVFERINRGIQNYAPCFIPHVITIVRTDESDIPIGNVANSFKEYTTFLKEHRIANSDKLNEVQNLANQRRDLYMKFVRFNLAVVSLIILTGIYQIFEMTILADIASTVQRMDALSIATLQANQPWTATAASLLVYTLVATLLIKIPLQMILKRKYITKEMTRILTGFWWETRDKFPAPIPDGPEKLDGDSAIASPGNVVRNSDAADNTNHDPTRKKQ